jgi:dihydrofolate reductase
MPDARPRCSVFIATSLDGFIARPDGSLDWLGVVEQNGEDYGYQRFADSVDVLVVGRKTYETALGFDGWPYSGKRCIVLTHRPSESRHGEEFFAGEPQALVDRLGREGARRVYVDGGQVIQQFLAANLIDDLTLSVIPLLLGEGIPLFARGPEQRLILQEARSWPTGLTQLHYRMASRAR